MKNSRATLFFKASARCSKILNVRSIFNTVKNSRLTLFSGQVQVTQNSKIIKNIFNTAKNFRALSVFQGKRKLLKNPECKKYIQYSENFRATLFFFRASASCSKIVNGEKIFDSLYSLGADPCNLG